MAKIFYQIFQAIWRITSIGTGWLIYPKLVNATYAYLTAHGFDNPMFKEMWLTVIPIGFLYGFGLVGIVFIIIRSVHGIIPAIVRTTGTVFSVFARWGFLLVLFYWWLGLPVTKEVQLLFSLVGSATLSRGAFYIWMQWPKIIAAYMKIDAVLMRFIKKVS
ncbi:hypothetical protein DUK53_16950 [Listeria sp. SHR_NRA_18]|uniref:hypothetical protein n=1 Tax=Listeria sp. SHR_NRA_18 TaxID=2269046 RepID=UPI000F5F7E7C|nr:hypothetical protein [Listeria sp. SHR_NRA_18]RQW65324.1 hypothetical protein DUK53_16950 [Listeria sp. SHR_NRA_18]